MEGTQRYQLRDRLQRRLKEAERETEIADDGVIDGSWFESKLYGRFYDRCQHYTDIWKFVILSGKND